MNLTSRSRAALFALSALLTSGFGLAAQDVPTVPTQGFTAEAVADFDGDGRADFAVAGEDAVTVSLDAGGSVKYTVPGVYSVAALDLDGDSTVDLVTVGKENQVTLWLNDKTGQFKAAVSAQGDVDPSASDLNLFILGEMFRSDPASVKRPLPLVSRKAACDGVPREYRPAICSYFHALYCKCISGELLRQIPPGSPMWEQLEKEGCGQFMKTLTECNCRSIDYRKPSDEENCFSWLPVAAQ